MPKKVILCIIICHFSTIAFAKKNKPHFTSPSLLTSRLFVKANLFKLSDFSLPNINFSAEYFLKNGGSNSVSLDLGYTYFSIDENTKAKGYTFSPKFLIYNGNKLNRINAFAIGVFYNKTFINDYLKTTKNLNGLGNYYEYEKLKYQKVRMGISIERVVQFSIFEKVFAEISYGLALVNFQTKVPQKVTQSTFVNGLILQKTYNGITPLFSTKIGYCF